MYRLYSYCQGCQPPSSVVSVRLEEKTGHVHGRLDNWTVTWSVASTVARLVLAVAAIVIDSITRAQSSLRQSLRMASALLCRIGILKDGSNAAVGIGSFLLFRPHRARPRTSLQRPGL